jgi:DNA modification methylase
MRTARILVGDVRERLRDLPDASVQCCVTSPPYWGLRDYGVSGQLGLERKPQDYVTAMVSVFAEVWRVLRDDGTCWINLGDSYCASAPGICKDPMSTSGLNGIGASKYRADREALRASNRSKTFGDLKPKDLVGIPWRVAFALQAEGWYLRSDVIWSKPNPMPESVTDRPTKAHEYIFLLTKSERYYYDADAIKEQAAYAGEQLGIVRGQKRRADAMGVAPSGNERPGADADIATHRNKRSVWYVATQPYPDAHFATYPEALIEPCILAGSRVDDTVLDPFCGSGTTGVVACRHNRHFIGVELNPQYAALAEKRITGDAGLFNRVELIA